MERKAGSGRAPEADGPGPAGSGPDTHWSLGSAPLHHATRGYFVWGVGETLHLELKVCDSENGPASRRRVQRKSKQDEKEVRGDRWRYGTQIWERGVGNLGWAGLRLREGARGSLMARGAVAAGWTPSAARELTWSAFVAPFLFRATRSDQVSPGFKVSVSLVLTPPQDDPSTDSGPLDREVEERGGPSSHALCQAPRLATVLTLFPEYPRAPP